jgi:hypothetical protein
LFEEVFKVIDFNLTMQLKMIYGWLAVSFERLAAFLRCLLLGCELQHLHCKKFQR